jgi:hypothetical protein
MQSRCLKVAMILLILIQPVASLSSACAMSVFSDQQAPAALNTAEPSTSYEELPDETGHNACHESVAPAQTEMDKCKSCKGDASCATSCSIASPIFSSAFFSGDIALSHAQYESITQSHYSQSPSELYRPPRRS